MFARIGSQLDDGYEMSIVSKLGQVLCSHHENNITIRDNICYPRYVVRYSLAVVAANRCHCGICAVKSDHTLKGKGVFSRSGARMSTLDDLFNTLRCIISRACIVTSGPCVDNVRVKD